MNIFGRLFQEDISTINVSNIDSIEKVSEDVVKDKFDELIGDFKLRDKITVYSLEQNFGSFSTRDYLELILVISHHTILISEEDVKKIEDRVGNMFIFEEQYQRLSSKLKKYCASTIIYLR